MDNELLESDGVAIALQQYGLRAWLDIFQRDLNGVYVRRGEWMSVSEFVSLSRHVERLMWQLGAIPWETEEGQLKIDIPLASDQLALEKLSRELMHDDLID